MIPTSNGRNVKIPIKIVEGKLRVLPDGNLPKLKEGAVGDLIVSAEALVDALEAKEYSQEYKKPFLPAESLLMARIHPDKVPSKLRDLARYDATGLPGAGVGIILIEEQHVLLRGTKNTVLLPCACGIPSLGQEAKSINHAYALISQAFEPHRISHTGNVFAKVYYQDPISQFWNPLKALRGH